MRITAGSLKYAAQCDRPVPIEPLVTLQNLEKPSLLLPIDITLMHVLAKIENMETFQISQSSEIRVHNKNYGNYFLSIFSSAKTQFPPI
ncbi:MAG: hypothetical protein H8K08_17420 [Nitrospira sp.]|nr:hypothetical protein [Nitrospira sp.]